MAELTGAQLTTQIKESPAARPFEVVIENILQDNTAWQ
jgi:hypothetical protein